MAIHIDLYSQSTNKAVIAYQKNPAIYGKNTNKLSSSSIYTSYRYSTSASNSIDPDIIKLGNFSNTKNTGLNRKLQDAEFDYSLDSYGSISQSQSMRSGNFNFTTGQFINQEINETNTLPIINDNNVTINNQNNYNQPIYKIGKPKPPALDPVSNAELEWKLFNKDDINRIIDVPPIFPPPPNDICPLIWVCVQEI